jgi:hypothetical protein
MATTETFVPNRLYEIPLADLQPDPNQPRKYLDPAALVFLYIHKNDKLYGKKSLPQINRSRKLSRYYTRELMS